ncbi:unnamed protein product [Caenorhabditis brenneri]
MTSDSDNNSRSTARVFILNSNAQEVETGPGPHLVYRTIGGRIDMAFFPGPNSEEVVNQYLQHIGFPFLPAYWALGYQLCRWGYGSLDAMKTVISRNQALGIPLDVPYADIDYMNHYEDFTKGDNWSGFPAYTQQLHSQGLHIIVIFDPAVEVDYASFQRAINQDASFIEWARDDQVPHNIQDQYPMAKNTRVMLGNVWPERNTAFPDFLDTKNTNTKTTKTKTAGEFATFHKTLPFDGMWIDMNEPSNFDTGTYSSMEEQLATSKLSCPISGADASLEIPPYPTQAVYQRSGEYLFSKTLCMLGKTARRSSNFYDTKNLYGWSEARATYQAIPLVTGKRSAVISRSTFPSSGRYGGHWLGDNTARWEDLQTSVIGVMEFNMFGIPYVGSDICGLNGVSNEELCLRWHQFGAFSPFSRDHNSEGMLDQDPAVWPSVANAAKIALSFRYYYLPFLYSLHYNAARYGHTVIRPLFFEFPKDEETLTISEQFLWGSALMIAPALYQGQTSVHAYFPSDTWYSLQPETYGKKMFAGFNDVSAPLASLTPVFVRGGFILPRQAANTTTTASRLNPFEVLITVKTNAASSGELYYDGGDDLIPNDDIEQHPRVHWQFSFTSSVVGGVFTGNCETCSTSVKPPSLDTIEILGYPSSPNFTGFKLDGASVSLDMSKTFYDASTQRNWSGFPAYTQQLHSQGLHLIGIFDPAVEVDYALFQRDINQDASFIEWARDDQVPHNIQDQYPMAKNTRVMLGNVWPERNTAFPDFLDTKNNTNNWWAGEFATFHKTLPFDGMWIDMNEPSNFDTGTYSSMEEQLATSKLSCPISGADASLEIPPYPTQAVYQRSGEYLFSKTLCMLGKTARRSRNFYDTKNLYGWSEARATYQAIPLVTGKRSAVISRSTFPSSGRYGGHWLGDNTARWEDLQTSVIGVMEFNLFGIPYVGSDICGFNGKSNEELCLRWHQFGAFSPFSRDHNSEGMPDQDPAVWPSVANAAKIALSFRYYYLPFLYSLHYNAARYGHTVIRPLFFEFPKDEETLTISEQFLWGSALMIAPALYQVLFLATVLPFQFSLSSYQGQTSVHAYFPSDTWYSLQPETYGKKMFAGFKDVSAPLASLTPVFVRGGFILPRQAANTTTTASRLNPFEVLITVKTNAASSGELYYDGGDELIPNDDIEQHPRVHWQFSFTSSVVGGVFTGNCETCSTSVKPPTLDTIEILGYPSSPNFTGFKLDGASVSLDMSKTFYDASTQRVMISSKNLISLMALKKKFTLSFSNN